MNQDINPDVVDGLDEHLEAPYQRGFRSDLDATLEAYAYDARQEFEAEDYQ